MKFKYVTWSDRSFIFSFIKQDDLINLLLDWYSYQTNSGIPLSQEDREKDRRYYQKEFDEATQEMKTHMVKHNSSAKFYYRFSILPLLPKVSNSRDFEIIGIAGEKSGPLKIFSSSNEILKAYTYGTLYDRDDGNDYNEIEEIH